MSSIHVRALAGLVARTKARVVAELKRQPHGVPPDDLAAMRLPWFEVRNEHPIDPLDADGNPRPAEDSSSTIFIYDEIGGSMGVDASVLVHEIEAITAPTISVRINSPGGSVFDAVAIYNALNHHPARIVTYVDALAASAASVIAMAGDEIVMMPGSQMMIHDASATENGNAEDHRKLGTFLDRQSDNLADLYRLRAGGTAEAWRALMLDETWAFAQEAVDLRLADRVEAPPVARPRELEPEEPGEIEQRMVRAHDLSHFRYAGRSAAPAPGTPRVRQHRATTSPREPMAASRAEAAAARKRAFQDQAAVEMPDRTLRRQTRSATLGPGDTRRQPFGAQVRGQLETRDGRELYHVSGYATVFGRPYPMWDSFGEYDEVVIEGAADLTLLRDPDVSFLVNHGGVTMARTTNGSLKLEADRIGLQDDAWLNPNRPDVQILMSAIDDGLVTEQSFAFTIPDAGGRWNDDFSRFEIRQFNLDRGDVSAVNYGANPYTSIAATAGELIRHADLLTSGQQRALAAKLGSLTERRRRQFSAADLEHDTAPLSRPVEPGREKVPEGRSLAAIEVMLKNG